MLTLGPLEFPLAPGRNPALNTSTIKGNVVLMLYSAGTAISPMNEVSIWAGNIAKRAST